MSMVERIGTGIDSVAKAVSPRWFAGRCHARLRAKLAERFGYDALKSSRLKSKRTALSGPGDAHLDESALSELRDICRDMGRNNPIVKGLLATEADDVVGTQTTIQARAKSKAWNETVEALFKAEMVDQACDVTGRFNIQKLVYTAFQSYRRDGDVFLILNDQGIEAIEGDQVGTPTARPEAKHFNVTNGVATSKQTGHVLGYYVGKPNQWGFIEPGSWRHLEADQVHHIWNGDRFSYTRGEPILTSAVTTIDKVSRYIDAELVAAHVNACLSIFVTKEDDLGLPSAYTEGISSNGTDSDGVKLQKVEPGEIHHLNKGESINAVIPTRPAAAFDPFILRGLMLACRPMCMPLMLATLDFSGATYMNARIAYQAAQKNYRREQDLVVRPMVSRIYLWWLARKITAGQIRDRKDAFAHEVTCQRWPYVDPYREAQADKIELENRTTSRSHIAKRKGLDYRDLVEQRQRDRQVEETLGETPETEKTPEDRTGE